MKSQINLLNQLQELILARDEHNQTGDGSRMDALDESIDALVSKLEPQPRALYQRLYKKDHVVMTPMVNGSCAVCGMHLPISQVQQVRLAKTIQTCSSCGRMIFYEDDSAPRSVAEKPVRGEPRKTGINRFSAEELVIADLKAKNPAEAVRELAEAMAANKFVSNPAALVVAALEREAILPTAVGWSLAFPHVRGVEGGGLTLALGISRQGIDWDNSGEKVHFIFFSVIPTAVSVFYLRLMAGLTEAFSKQENRDALMSATNNTELWKAFMKATRYTIR